MYTGKIAVLFAEDYTLMDRIIWNLYHRDVWRLIDTEWIDGSSDIGYIGTITGNRFVVKFLDKYSHRKHIKYFAREDV